MSLAIRRATERDAGTILALIRGLATYERLADDVSCTEDDLVATLFSGHPRAFCEIADWNGRAVGLALWFYNYSTFLGRHGMYLEDLYVDEAMRGHGIGKGLLQHLARICLTEKLGRFEWSVLDWNEPAIGFYEKHGASILKEWLGCRLTGDALEKLAAE